MKFIDFPDEDDTLGSEPLRAMSSRYLHSVEYSLKEHEQEGKRGGNESTIHACLVSGLSKLLGVVRI